MYLPYKYGPSTPPPTARLEEDRGQNRRCFLAPPSSPPQIRRVSEFSSGYYERKTVVSARPSPQSVIIGPPITCLQSNSPSPYPCYPLTTTTVQPTTYPSVAAKRVLPVLPTQRVIAPPARSSAAVAPKREQFHFILATIQRSDIPTSWGLSIQEQAPGIFVISKVAETSTAVVDGYCEVKSINTHPSVFLYRNRQPLHLRARAVLTEQAPIVSKRGPIPLSHVLRPGDVMLSVAGRPAGECANLTGWCQWLRSEDTLSSLWIIARTPIASARKWSRPKAVVSHVKYNPVVLEPINEAFKDPQGKDVRFNDPPDDPDEGERASLFLLPIHDFSTWLATRKRSWRETYTTYPLQDDVQEDDVDREDSLPEISKDFWTVQGFASLNDWLAFRTKQWQSQYSWNRQKRQRLAQDCQATQVSLDDDWKEWLRVRKNQWVVERRRRQRERGESAASTIAECVAVDTLLEEQEQKRIAFENRPPLNIMFLFDAAEGCPDDVVYRILSFLETPDHATLLRVSHSTRTALQNRQMVWSMLCPDTWTLPRRPRKPWHQIYWSRLRVETERRKKKWDDLLTRGSQLLFQGDSLSTIERMVAEAERDCNFDVNYVSGVVCERNSLLNLAVIHRRHRKCHFLFAKDPSNLCFSNRRGEVVGRNKGCKHRIMRSWQFHPAHERCMGR